MAKHWILLAIAFALAPPALADPAAGGSPTASVDPASDGDSVGNPREHVAEQLQAVVASHVAISKDLWLRGGNARLHPDVAPVRPFLLCGGGWLQDPRGAHTTGLPERLYSRQVAGRVGGGIEVQPTERTSLRLQGSYLMPSLEIVEPSTTVGFQLEIRF